jgi:clan AA aspartic protease
MGITKVTTKLTSVEGERQSYEDVFLVDTGATDCLAPADELERIGVRRLGTMTYDLADGVIKEYAFGIAQIEFMGEITAGRVIFGDPGAEPLLGVTALESVGIMVDPAKKTMKRLPAIPLK